MAILARSTARAGWLVKQRKRAAAQHKGEGGSWHGELAEKENGRIWAWLARCVGGRPLAAPGGELSWHGSRGRCCCCCWGFSRGSQPSVQVAVCRQQRCNRRFRNAGFMADETRATQGELAMQHIANAHLCRQHHASTATQPQGLENAGLATCNQQLAELPVGRHTCKQQQLLQQL